MSKARRDSCIDFIFLAFLYAWIAAYSYPYFFESLTNSHQEIATYNLDSMLTLQAVKSALSSPWFRLHFNDYGHFYFNLAIGVSYIVSLFQPLTERTIFFILRLVALLGGCFTVGAAFLFARRFLGRNEAVFVALSITFSPALAEYFEEVKPDTWQIFFDVLTLYFLARAVEMPGQSGVPSRPRAADFRFVLAAASAAGAAFGTKYLGVLFIPLLAVTGWMVPTEGFSGRFFGAATKCLLVLAGALIIPMAMLGYAATPPAVLLFFLVQPQHVQSYLGNGAGGWSSPYWIIQGSRVLCFLASFSCLAFLTAALSGLDLAAHRKTVLKSVIFLSLGLAFIGTFFLTSPWLLWHLDFIPQLYFRSDIESAGPWGGFHWLPVLFSPDFITYGTGALSVFGAILLLVALFRGKFRRAYLPFLFVLGFAVIFITLLVAHIHDIVIFHALAITPPLVLLAAFGLHEIRNALAQSVGERKSIMAAGSLATLLIAWQVWQGATTLLRYDHLVTAMPSYDRMLGDWFAHCAPPGARILTASYSYVPPSFFNAQMGEGYRDYVRINPEVVTIGLADAASFSRPTNPGYSKWVFDAENSRHYYDLIMHSDQWRAGPVFGPFQVYTKSGSGVAMTCR